MKDRGLLTNIIPNIDNLPQCWRIVWFGQEWIIPKSK